VEWAADKTHITLEVLPRRWVVERTFAWILKNRRLVRDYEQITAVAETSSPLPRQPRCSEDGNEPMPFSNALLGKGVFRRTHADNQKDCRARGDRKTEQLAGVDAEQADQRGTYTNQSDGDSEERDRAR